MRDVAVGLELLTTGYCWALDAALRTGGKLKRVKVPASCALIKHPQKGVILFDSGYAEHFFAATRDFPYWLYRLLTPVRLEPEEAARSQLLRRGISPAEVRHIIISHLHGDHIAGLRDFFKATFWLSADTDGELERRGLRALRRGYLSGLLPPDFDLRARILPPPGKLKDFGPFKEGSDLFGDGSLIAVALPGHAAGQVGLLVRTETGRVLLAADACWHSRDLRDWAPPSRAARLLAHDPAALCSSLAKLRELRELHSEVSIVPAHCPEALSAFYKSPKVAA